MRLVPKRLRWMGLGAVAAWLFDPERGSARRAQLSDKFEELKRKTPMGAGNGHKVTTPAPGTPTPTPTPAPPAASPTAGTAKAPAAAARATG